MVNSEPLRESHEIKKADVVFVVTEGQGGILLCT